MKSIAIIAILGLLTIKMSFPNENVYYQYLWQNYLNLWNPGLPPNVDMRRLLNKASNGCLLDSREAKEIIKQGKMIVPFIISVGEVSCSTTKMNAIAIIKKIYRWEDNEMYDSDIEQYWANMKKRFLETTVPR